MNEYTELLKSLNQHDNQLVRHMVEGTIHAIEGAPEEEARRHVFAFLHALNYLVPEMFEHHDLPTTLEKDGQDGWDALVKTNMAAKGHFYYGEISKHYLGIMGSGEGRMDVRGYGPNGVPNPNHSPTHSYRRPQKVHGRGSGKRNLMELATAYKKLHPSSAKDIGTWNEMKAKSQETMMELADKYDFLFESRGGTGNVVDADESDATRLKRRARDVSQYASLPELGAGKVLSQKKGSAMTALVHILRENGGKLPGKGSIKDKAKRLGVHGKARTPEEEKLPKGKQAYGPHDPNETLEDQPHMNSLKAKQQKLAQKLKNDAKRKISPKVRLKDLSPAEEPVPAKEPSKAGATRAKAKVKAAVGASEAQAAAETKAKIKNKVQSGSPTPEGSADEPGEGGWADLAQTAKNISDRIHSQGAIDGLNSVGMTLDGETLSNAKHKTGYYVSLQGAEKRTQRVNNEIIAAYLEEHKDAIQRDNFGVWAAGEKYLGGKVYLDVTRHFDSREEAEKFGRENKQAAMWDIAAGEQIDISPDDDPEGVRIAHDTGESLAQMGDAAEFARHERESPLASSVVNQRPDPQQRKLYAAEMHIVNGKTPSEGMDSAPGVEEYAHPMTPVGASDEEVQRILQAEVDRIVTSAWWKRTFRSMPKVVVQLPTPIIGATAGRGHGQMNISKDRKWHTSGTLLHELIHMVTSNEKEGHGPEYAANHLAAVRHFRGAKVAEWLERSYAHEGVKVTPSAARSWVPDKSVRNKMEALYVKRTAAMIARHKAKAEDDPARIQQWTKKIEQIEAEMARVHKPGPSTEPAYKPSPDHDLSVEDKVALHDKIVREGVKLDRQKRKYKGVAVPKALQIRIDRNKTRQARLRENLQDRHKMEAAELKRQARSAQRDEAAAPKRAIAAKYAAGLDKLSENQLMTRLANLQRAFINLSNDLEGSLATPENRAKLARLKSLRAKRAAVGQALREKHGLTAARVRAAREAKIVRENDSAQREARENVDEITRRNEEAREESKAGPDYYASDPEVFSKVLDEIINRYSNEEIKNGIYEKIYSEVYNPAGEPKEATISQEEYKEQLEGKGYGFGYWFRRTGKSGSLIPDEGKTDSASIRRFYMNVKPDHAAGFSGDVLDQLDKAGIKFDYKMPTLLENFKRSDSAVLYVDKGDFAAASRILSSYVDKNPDHFAEGTPKLTRVLGKGLATAEEPVQEKFVEQLGPQGGVSFGSSHALLISLGLSEALYANPNATNEQKKKEVLDTYRQLGLDVNRPWLNSASVADKTKGKSVAEVSEANVDEIKQRNKKAREESKASAKESAAKLKAQIKRREDAKAPEAAKRILKKIEQMRAKESRNA